MIRTSFVFIVLMLLACNTRKVVLGNTTNCEKCKIEYVRDIKLNIDSLSEKQILLFLCSFDEQCSNNVEYSQFSNKMLFLLLSKYPLRTIKMLSEDKSIAIKEIEKTLQNPVSDRIDLNQLYKQVEEIEDLQETTVIILNSIRIAIEKYN